MFSGFELYPCWVPLNYESSNKSKDAANADLT